MPELFFFGNIAVYRVNLYICCLFECLSPHVHYADTTVIIF